jgi:hypothetical protein
VRFHDVHPTGKGETYLKALCIFGVELRACRDEIEFGDYVGLLLI